MKKDEWLPLGLETAALQRIDVRRGSRLAAAVAEMRGGAGVEEERAAKSRKVE